MIVQFGEWLPDQPRLANTCITATNVLPTENGYGPMSSTSISSDALASTCKGVVSFRRVNGTRETFAGTTTKLYRKDGQSWTDVSKSGDYSATNQWRFALYGERLVATNGEDNPQKFDLASDSQFADLTNAPKHRFPIVVRDTLVALDLQDGSGDEVAFSAVNDSETWTAIAGGGAQNFPDGGPVVGGVGGEYGIILQEQGVTRMEFVGGDLRFTFDKVEGAIGCVGASTIVPYKGGVFYLGTEGFQFFDGSLSTDISSGKITDFFLSAVDIERHTSNDDTRVTSSAAIRIIHAEDNVIGALDPENSSVVWQYPASTGNEIVRFNYRLGRWTSSDQSVDCLHTSFSAAGTTLAGFDSSNRLVRFNSDTALIGTLSTGDIPLIQGRSAMLTSIRPLVDAISPDQWTDPPDTIDSGWTDNGGGSYTCDGTAGAGLDITTNTATIGRSYKLTFNVDAHTSGNLVFRAGGSSETVTISRTGQHSSTVTATAATLFSVASASFGRFTGTISNVSIRPVDVTVAKKTDLADTETVSRGATNSRGRATLRSHGKYHRIEVSPASAYTEISGVELEVRQGGSKV